MGTWAQYGAGMWESKPDQQNLQRVPNYPADVPQTNWLLGAAGLLVLAYLAHRHLGRRRK